MSDQVQLMIDASHSQLPDFPSWVDFGAASGFYAQSEQKTEQISTPLPNTAAKYAPQVSGPSPASNLLLILSVVGTIAKLT
jgi:hypothetical protein